MNDEMTDEQLAAIMGEDPTVLAELLRKKHNAEDRAQEGYQMKRGARNEVIFDPLGVVADVVNSRRANKEAAATQPGIDEQLGKLKDGKMTYAKMLQGARGGAQAAQEFDPSAGPTHAAIPASPVVAPSAPTQFFNPSAPKPPAPPQAPPQGPGAMPSGEPLRGPPVPGAARPPLAQAATMSPQSLQAAGVPPDVLAKLLRDRGMR
jgi:hypothetical protein